MAGQRRGVRTGLLAALLLVIGVALGLSQGHAQTPLVLSRYPYIQSPTTSSVVIAWDTNRAATSRVDYGLTPDFGLWVASDVPATRHALTLTGLSAGTRYWYRVEGDGATLMGGESFRSAKGPDAANVSFAVLGDSGSGSPDQVAVAQQMLKHAPDFVLHTGDVVYDRGEAENYGPRFFDIYRDILKSTAFFPSLGNHDYGTDNGQPYLDAFYLPANNPDGTERYYSFDYGDARFIALDVETDYAPGSPQYTWLEQQLRDRQALWTFVFFHKPPYTSSSHKNDADLPPIRQHLSPLFERYGVDVVFNGHDHDYERTVPIRDFYPDGKGVAYVVSGGGGARLYEAGQSSFTAYSESAFHAVFVAIDGPVLSLQAIRADGTLMDSYVLDRSTEAPVVTPVPTPVLIPGSSALGLWVLAFLILAAFVAASYYLFGRRRARAG